MTWVELAIGDLGRVVTGDTPPRKNPEYYGSAYPFIKPTDMTVGQRLTTSYEEGYSEEGFSKYRKKLIPAGSTAVVTIGSIGQKLTWLHENCFVNQAVNAVVPNKEKFDSLYVYYLLKHNLNLVKQADTGASSGRENVSKSNFSALKVLVCLDIDTQRRIAEVLDSIDSAIETNHRRIALLEDTTHRLYREWFIHLRFPGHELLPVQSGVPLGWRSAPLGTLLKTSSGGTPSRKRPDFFGAGIRWVKTKELNDRFLFETEEEITLAGLEGSSAKVFPVGTVLLAMYGATIGMTALLAKSAATNQACCALLVAETPGLSYYSFQWLKEIKQKLISLGTGAAQPNLSQEVIRKLDFLMPSTQILNAYDEAVAPLFEQIALLMQQERALTRARDLLIPKLMSGQLDVSNIPLPEDAVV